MTQEEKKVYALKWYGIISNDEIKKTLSISKDTFNRLTKFKRDEEEKQRNNQIYDMWMRCETQEKIAEEVGVTHQTISNVIAKIANLDQLSENCKFRDFQQENSALRIYDIWNFSKATNEVKHFGNIPPEIIDNLFFNF